MDIATVLNRAADRLEQKGWTQHRGGGGDGPNCTSIAIFLTTAAVSAGTGTVEDTYQEALRVFKRFISERYPSTRYRSIPWYNDYVAVNKEQVIADLREAARACGPFIEEERLEQQEREETAEVIREAEEIIREAGEREPALV